MMPPSQNCHKDMEDGGKDVDVERREKRGSDVEEEGKKTERDIEEGGKEDGKKEDGCGGRRRRCGEGRTGSEKKVHSTTTKRRRRSKGRRTMRMTKRGQRCICDAVQRYDAVAHS